MKRWFDWENPLCCRLFPTGCHWFLVGVLTLSSVMVVLSLISMVLLLTEIEGALAVSPTHGMWLARIFLFTVGLSPLFAVRMGFVFGFKRVFVIGCVAFLLGASLTPFIDHYYVMLFCRLIGGLGGGVVVTLSLAIIARHTPSHHKKVTLAVSSSVAFGGGIALGLLYSGYIGQLGRWEWMSFPDLVLSIPVILGVLLLCPESLQEDKPRYDLVSLFSLFTLSFSLFLVATQAKEPWNTMGWHSGFVAACFLTAGVSLVILIFATIKRDYPLFDHRLIKDPIFLVAAIGMGIVGVMIFGITLTSIGMLEHIYKYEKWTVGWLLSTIGVIYCFGGIIPSLFCKWVSPVLFILLGVLLITISCFISHSVTVQSTKLQLFILFSIRSSGVALTLGPITAFALTNLPQEIAPRGAAIITFIRQMGGAFGSGIIQTIQITREAFHTARFGEMVSPYSPRYQQFYTALNTRISDEVSSGPIVGGEQTTQVIIADIVNQSRIASLVDAIWVFGWIFGALFLVMIGVLVWHHRRSTNPLSSPT